MYVDQSIAVDPMSRFSAVVRRIIETPPEPLEVRACPDQIVGTLSQLQSDGMIAARAPASNRPNHSAVLLVLESPHTYEFKDPSGPAKGSTGRLIARHGLSVRGLQGSDNASLVLINAIQYQCSLGEKPSRYRDEVFLAAWQEFGRSDFCVRLKAIYRANDIVVCACTKGDLGLANKSLRQLVYEAIVEVLPKQARVLRRTHPSSWHSQRCREYEWSAAERLQDS
jgi:hypothetical protein